MALDLELTQPNQKIIQIGACIGNLYTGDILETFSAFVDPGEVVSEFIENLTGISNAIIEEEGQPLDEAFLALVQAWRKHSCSPRMLTWGGGDHSALKASLSPGTYWPFGRRWMDVKTLFEADQLRKGAMPRSGLKKACLRAGVGWEGRAHDALYDAFNTFKIARRLILGNPKEET